MQYSINCFSIFLIVYILIRSRFNYEDDSQMHVIHFCTTKKKRCGISFATCIQVVVDIAGKSFRDIVNETRTFPSLIAEDLCGNNLARLWYSLTYTARGYFIYAARTLERWVYGFKPWGLLQDQTKNNYTFPSS